MLSFVYGTPCTGWGGVDDELKSLRCQDLGSGLPTRRILTQPHILSTIKTPLNQSKNIHYSLTIVSILNFFIS